MPQQINLCTPILLTQKRYFTAQTMALSLAALVLVGGGLCAYGVWSLNVASEGFRQTLATQSRELESLQTALQQSKASAGPASAALTQEIQRQKTALLQREIMLQELHRGLFRPGWGHSARLLLIAQTIPAPVWVTDVKADEAQLTVMGFTLEPAALNDWVNKLAASPLLQGQKLSSVQVARASAAVMPTAQRPLWSFTLVNSVGHSAAAAGVTP